MDSSIIINIVPFFTSLLYIDTYIQESSLWGNKIPTEFQNNNNDNNIGNDSLTHRNLATEILLEFITIGLISIRS